MSSGRTSGLLAILLLRTAAACTGELAGGGDAPDAATSAPDAPVGDGAATPLDASPDAPPGAPDAPPGPDPCAPIPGAAYVSQVTAGPVTDRPAPLHADLNIHLRGWEPTGGTLGLIDIGGDTDPGAPDLFTLFADDRVPTFVQNYRVHDWDWGTNSRAGAITSPEVTMAGFATAPGEILETPTSAYVIGPDDRKARVLYAADDTITLKYTAEDNVVAGYTIHIVGLCVEPSLRARYDADDAAGRPQLPVLVADQPIGRARGSQVLVVIRDTGSFMDPRSRKDWW